MKKNIFSVFNMFKDTGAKNIIIYFIIIFFRIAYPIILSFLWKYFIDYITYNITNLVLVNVIIYIGIILLLSFIYKYLYEIYYQDYFSYKTRSLMQNKITLNFLKKTSRFDMANLEDSKLHDDIVKIDRTMIWYLPIVIEHTANLIVAFVTFIITLIILITYSPIVALSLVLINIPLLLVWLKKSKTAYSVWDATTPNIKLLYYLKSLLQNKISLRELKLYGVGKKILNKFDRYQTEIINNYEKPIKEYKNKILLPTILSYIVIGMVLVYYLNDLVLGVITIGTFLFIKDNVFRLSNETERFYMALSELYNSNLYADEYFKFLNREEGIKEVDNPKSLNAKNGVKIEFKNVSFKYDGTKDYALKNISFILEENKHLAIVGENGSGKSTLIKLLFRIYDPSEGEILLNDINIKKLSIKKINEIMSTLFQDYINYNFTVKESVTISDSRRTTEDEISKAIESAEMNEVISKLPNKLDQQLGREYKDGLELSGGQWQRLAIARTLYKNSKILVLDEGTSSIDIKAEYKIYQNIFQEEKQRTIIVIAHRLFAIKNADKIIVLDKGKIVEQGKHKDLMKKDLKYKKMYDLQKEQIDK